MSPPAPTNRHTTRTRDAALRRLSQANRWLLAGSAALTAAFTAAAATAFPGRKSTTDAVRSTRTRHADPRTTGTSSTQLQAPAQAPRTSTQAGTGGEAGASQAGGSEAGASQAGGGEASGAATPQAGATGEGSPESGSAAAPSTSSGASESTESAPVVSGGS